MRKTGFPALKYPAEGFSALEVVSMDAPNYRVEAPDHALSAVKTNVCFETYLSLRRGVSGSKLTKEQEGRMLEIKINQDVDGLP